MLRKTAIALAAASLLGAAAIPTDVAALTPATEGAALAGAREQRGRQLVSRERIFSRPRTFSGRGCCANLVPSGAT